MGRPPKNVESIEENVSQDNNEQDTGNIRYDDVMNDHNTESNKSSKYPFEGKVTAIKDYLNTKLDQITEMATLEHKLPLHARLKNRLTAIKTISSAKHMKIEGHWLTTPPQIHISALKSEKISNDEARISFRVFKVDEKGNKILHENKVKEYSHVHEKEIEKVSSANYVIDYEVREVLKSGEKIKREILKYESPEEALKR